MLNSLYLTPQETKSLDVADCHDICESMIGWNMMSERVRTDLFLSMMHYVEGQEINMFHELLLADASLRWKEKKHMNDKVTKWISPELINEKYTRMRECVDKTHKLQIEIAELKASLETQKAKLAQDPDFKWGKNETEREAQMFAAFPRQYEALQKANIELQKLANDKALVQLDLEQIKTMIDFYGVIDASGE